MYNVLFFYDFIVGQLNVIHLHSFMYLELFLVLIEHGLIDLSDLILLFSISTQSRPNPIWRTMGPCRG